MRSRRRLFLAGAAALAIAPAASAGTALAAPVAAPAPQFTLTVSTSGSGTGHVTGPGIDCPGICSAVYDKGTKITLAATPDPDSAFSGWGGACAAKVTCTVRMTADMAVSAAFTAQRTLTVTEAGSGRGRVTSSPPGIRCGTTCSQSFDLGSTIILTATPSASSAFIGWSGACSGKLACTVTMGADQSVTANFTARRTLTVTTTGPGHGHVVGPGIDCPGDCSQVYDRGTKLTLHTPHGSNSSFVGWGGACSDRGSCSLKMNSDRSASAKFVFKPPTTELTKARISSSRRRASFGFDAKRKSSGFQCKLSPKHHAHKRFRKCRSPKRYRHLATGEYTFKVRAMGPGGVDPTAAKKTFRIKRR